MRQHALTMSLLSDIIMNDLKAQFIFEQDLLRS